ncbi:alpha/beta-hydrolase [Hymenopellis radicata]|nr:alpha/beta-hydrolase [Hymenopellis radicata]
MDPTPNATITKLVVGAGEPPLIIFHGAGGLALDLIKYQRAFTTAVWVVQITNETPLTDFTTLIDFYAHKIKQAQPSGPYRFAGYSGSSMIALAVARAFERRGDVVMQLAFLDHFPTLHLYQSNSIGNPNPRTADGQQKLLECNISTILTLCALHSAKRVQAMVNVLEQLEGIPPHMLAARRNIKLITLLVGEFLYDVTTCASSGLQSVELLRRWVGELKAPTTVYLASRGVVLLCDYDWQDLGMVNLVKGIEGTHFDFLMNAGLVCDLQKPVLAAQRTSSRL